MPFLRRSDITGLSCQTPDRHLIKGTLLGCFSRLCLEPHHIHFTGSRDIWGSKFWYFIFLNGLFLGLQTPLKSHLIWKYKGGKMVVSYCFVFKGWNALMNSWVPITIFTLLTLPCMCLSQAQDQNRQNNVMAKDLCQWHLKLEDSHEKASKKAGPHGFSWPLWSCVHDLC